MTNKQPRWDKKNYVFFQFKKCEKRKRKNTNFEDNSMGLNHQVLLCKHQLYGEGPHTQQARKCVQYALCARLEWRRKNSAPPIEPLSVGRKKAFPCYKLLASMRSSLPEPYSFSQSVGGWISPRELAQIMSPYLSAL